MKKKKRQGRSYTSMLDSNRQNDKQKCAENKIINNVQTHTQIPLLCLNHYTPELIFIQMMRKWNGTKENNTREKKNKNDNNNNNSKHTKQAKI